MVVNHLANLSSILKVLSNNRLPFGFVRNTKLNYLILKFIFNLGYLRAFHIENFYKIKIFLSYSLNLSVIRGSFLISKPSSRVYFSANLLRRKKLGKFFKLNGFTLCSSNQKLLTDVECLILGIGCEPLLFIF